jgi:putative phage-type endonuclease
MPGDTICRLTDTAPVVHDKGGDMSAITRSKWLEQRRHGVGGSDAAAILGLSKWKTPLEVYQEKRGERHPQPDNESMLWGRALEPAIRQQYAERTGRVVRVPESIITHPEHAFMLANLDGITDDRRVLEVKTARIGQDWGEPGSDEIPQAYLLQVQHYMAVTGFEVADVAVLIGGSDFRLYEVPADRELQEMLIAGEAEFWQRVVDGNPPEPVSLADVQSKFGRTSNYSAIEASTEVLAAFETIKAIKEQLEAIEASEESAKAFVMKAMGEADTLKFAGNTIATWKLARPTRRFDSASFKEAHPALYEQFTKTGEPSRRFLIK